MRIDGLSFNVEYWGKKSYKDFKKELTEQKRQFLDLKGPSRNSWLKMAYGLLREAYQKDSRGTRLDPNNGGI